MNEIRVNRLKPFTFESHTYEEDFDEQCNIHNPLLEEWRKIYDRNILVKFPIIECSKRKNLVDKYAWSIPTHRALNTIVRQSTKNGVVDLFSGRGYWSKMIKAYGVDVIAVDDASETFTDARSRMSDPFGSALGEFKSSTIPNHSCLLFPNFRGNK